jgi:superfamily II DNA/RNA helicase
VDVLVTTPSLEEGIDVRVCRFVVRFDYFSTVRSHIQGSGRVRTTDAKIYYFEQDPDQEIKKADLVVRTAKGEATELEVEKQCAEQTIDGAETIEELGPHQWGEETTVWDVITNRSYRGMSCATCGCRSKIISKKFGQGKKKSKRTYVLMQGTVECKVRQWRHVPTD